MKKAFQTGGRAQIKAWKEDPSVPKDGTDIKFTDLGSWQTLV